MTTKVSMFYAEARRYVRRKINGDWRGLPYTDVKIERTPTGVNYTNGWGYTHFIDAQELKAARNAVKRGASLLDKKLPGWENQLVPQGLVLASCELCVCGQLAWATKAPEFRSIMKATNEDSFESMLRFLGLTDEDGNTLRESSEYGFCDGYDRNLDLLYSFEALEVEWHRLVSRRLRKQAREATA